MRYTTEKERLEALEKVSVYPVVTADFCAGRDPLDITRAVLEGGARIVQIREKSMADGPYLALLKAARKLTDQFGALLIADDRLDAALLAGADGVHLGQDDMSAADVRKTFNGIIGVSAHNEEESLKAYEDGADYIGCGAIFSTSTKSNTNSLGIEGLQKITRTSKLPVVAIGGIDENNISSLEGTDISGVAVVSAIFSKSDVRTATSCLSSVIHGRILR